MRKRLLQFDDVLNTQREVIYGIRNDAIHSDQPREILFEMIEEELEERIDTLAANKDDTDAEEQFISWLNAYFPIAIDAATLKELSAEAQLNTILERIHQAYDEREAFEEPEALKELARFIVVRTLDRRWQDHLTEMEELRRSVNLRSYGQKDPLNEYKSEAFTFFQELMTQVRAEICNSVFRSATNENAFHNMLSRLAEKVQTDGPQTAPVENALAAARSQAQPTTQPEAEVELPKVEPIRRELPKIGRNDLVTIRKGMETKELKFKKAEALILNEGWQIVSKQLNT